MTVTKGKESVKFQTSAFLLIITNGNRSVDTSALHQQNGEMGIRTRPVTQCPVCGSAGRVRHADLRDRAYSVAGSWEIAECTKCASGWLNTAPIPEDLGQCYVGAYYTHERPEVASLGRSQKAELLRRLVLSARKGYTELKPSVPFSSVAGSILARIPPVWSRACYSQEDLMPSFKANGRLLEIGCGGGAFLSIMQLLGWRVFGIEPHPFAAAVTKNALGGEQRLPALECSTF